MSCIDNSMTLSCIVVLTGVACYTGDVCGTTPQQVSSVSDCCLDNLSVLRSYKTVSDQETCVTCLGE